MHSGSIVQTIILVELTSRLAIPKADAVYRD